MIFPLYCKYQLLIIVAIIGLNFSELIACTSFTVYVDSGNILYGMNFDYPEVEMKLSITANDTIKFFHLQFYNNGFYSSTVGMNSNGFFSSCQMLYPEVNEWHYPGEKEIDIGNLYYYSLISCDSAESIIQYFNITDTKLIHTYGITLHDIFADKYGNSFVMEVGDTNPLITEIQNNFLVMSNFPNSDFEGQPYTNVTGVGAQRYKDAYKYISDNLAGFDISDGIETLKRTIQSSGGYKTQCSFLFDPVNLEIYIIIKRDFDKIRKVDLVNKTIETYAGFDLYEKFNIDADGILVSELENVATSKESNLSYNGFKRAYKNYPNPFNKYVNIEFVLNSSDFVSVEIFDSYGQKVKTIINDILNSGRYNFKWHPEKLKSGVYYSRLTVGDKVKTYKILYLDNY